MVTSSAACGTRWIVPLGPEDIVFYDGAEWAADERLAPDWSDHPAGEGGFPVSPSQVFVTVQGTSDVEVVLTGVELHVRRLGRAPVGTTLHRPCGGPGYFRWLAADLDADPPRIIAELVEDHVSVQGAPPHEREPIRFPYTVSSSDAEVFEIHAFTEDCDCEWWVVLSWQSSGESGTVVIDDDGEPFRTVGTSGVFATCEEDGTCRSPNPNELGATVPVDP